MRNLYVTLELNDQFRSNTNLIALTKSKDDHDNANHNEENVFVFASNQEWTESDHFGTTD